MLKINRTMNELTLLKKRIVISIYEFKDKCDTLGQNGVISTAIAESLQETLSGEQIKLIINQLNKLL